MKTLSRVPGWTVAALLFVLAYGGIDIALWLLFRRMHVTTWPPEVRATVQSIHQLVLCSSAVLYGLWRAVAFHPAGRNGYRIWLRTTPWHPGMPLPLGPITLTWWDAPVLLTSVALAHWHMRVSISLPLLAFSCGYLLASFVALRTTLPWGAYVVALGGAFVVRWIQTIDLAATFAVGLVAFTQIALNRSLLRFPWERDPLHDPPATPGWLAMIPNDHKPIVSKVHAVAASTLVGFWLWSAISLKGGPSNARDSALLAIVAVACASVVRWVAYCATYRPPLTILGRLLTGRLIICGYDVALVPLVAGPPLAGLAALLVARLGATASAEFAFGTAVGLAYLLMSPPDLRVWQLTGNHRAMLFTRLPVVRKP